MSDTAVEADGGGLAQRVRRFGLVAGPVLALVCYFLLPTEFADGTGKVVPFLHPGRATLAMLVWMAIWWMTEAVDIEVTALLPIVAFPLAGIMSIEEAAAPYSSSVVYLFLGGFVLALAIQRCGLDRRIAFLTLRLMGTTPGRLVGGMLATCAFLSMWISNTAAAAMMVPIAIAVVDLVVRTRTGAGFDPKKGIPADRVDERNFATALVLAIAYGASIGGVATLIGSPPNGIAARFIQQTYDVEVTFLKWLAVGLPLTLVFLPMAWFILVRVAFRSRLGPIEGGREYLDAELAKLGPLSRAERAVLAVFLATICLWITRPWVVAIKIGVVQPFGGLTDAGIAMIAALALFLIPVGGKAGLRAMDWSYAVQLPWGVLLLFGGGLSLAAATEATGVAAFIGSLTQHLGGLPPLVVVVAIVAVTVFASELTSNTAQVALMLPLLAAAAPGFGVAPALLLIPCTLAASLAFMMPVGTPPNAIVFGTGLVKIPQMVRAGLMLNLSAILVVTLFAYFVIGPLLADR
ncbi:MAG TPA: DASS family sodium-coupled anion symporter [Burkholderiales bacterium]|nr:DASS family sodium-coupled anion symporter [Burkholderiales bacterium]